MESRRKPLRPKITSLICFTLAAALANAPVRAESLQGKVVDRATIADSPQGKGVAGASVVLYDESGKKLQAKAVGKNGAFRFSKLKPGYYTLTAERKDYLPSPVVRFINVARGDTGAHDLYLDKLPTRNGAAVQGKIKKKKSMSPGYYPGLARAILNPSRHPAFYREGAAPVSMGRFFDATDTTEAYGRLWVALQWTEIESQNRPIASKIYLAHALDSTLREQSRPPLPALKAYLKIPADSMEALSLFLRKLIVSPSKKDSPADLAKFQVPKSMALDVVEEMMKSGAFPAPKRKAFLARAAKGDWKKVFPAEMVRRLAAEIQTRKPPRIVTSVLPSFDPDALWKVAQTQAAGGKGADARPNPVAVFQLGRRQFEQGHAREGVADIHRANSLRPDYGRALSLEADCRMTLGENPKAETIFDSLSKLDDPEWQARGFQGLGFLQWKSGRPEEAERSLMRSLGLESKSDSARKALYVLAAISLERDTWESVEAMLDTLVAHRPREAEAQYWLGRVAQKRKQDGVAEDRFRKAAALDPTRTEYTEAMATLAFAREDCDAALRILKPIRARLGNGGLSVYGECLLLGNKPKEAAAEFEKLYEAHPASGTQAQWAKALVAAGQAARAITMLQASPHARAPEVRKTLAEAYVQADSAAPAQLVLAPLLAASPNDPELHFLMGRSDFILRDYSGASKEFTDALRYREDYPEAVYQKGLCLLKSGSAGEAHHYFQELSDSRRRSWRARGLLGEGQAFAAENKLEAAEEKLTRSYNESPTAEAAAHLALTELRMQKVTEADAWAAKARQADPDHPLATMASVDVLLEQHREAEALDKAAAGLASHPASCDFVMVAAKAYLRAGKDAEAKDLSLRARDLCPSEPAPYFYLGSLSARGGVTSEAKQNFEAYVRAGGDAKRVPQAYR
jgi:tetratricopeptide (TPR) repeat protein